MPTHRILQVDAFTTQPLAGNPCAVIFDADTLTEETMLAIAREMNLSETAFVLTSGKADAAARYFTPAEEIPFAGHPTVATIFALVDTGHIKLNGDVTKVNLELSVGIIPIDIQAESGQVKHITMNQNKPQFLATPDPREVMPAFNLSESDLLPNTIIQIVSTGTPQLMIALKSHDALKRAQMDIPLYTALRDKHKFFSPHLFALGGATSQGDVFARHFGVPPDIMEDPFTGSATGGMSAFLWRYGLIDSPQFIVEQGHWMKRPGQAVVEVLGPPDDIQNVRVGGPAVTVMRGELRI